MSTAQRSRRLISTVHTTCVASPVRVSCHPAVTTESAHRISHEKRIRPSGVPGTQPPTAASKPDKAGGDECDIVASVPAIRRPERSIVRGISTFSVSTASAPGRTRTGNLRIRRPMLYPLSYGGVHMRRTRLRHRSGGSDLEGGRGDVAFNTGKPSQGNHSAITDAHRSRHADDCAWPLQASSRSARRPDRNAFVTTLQSLRNRTERHAKSIHPAGHPGLYVSNITLGSAHF